VADGIVVILDECQVGDRAFATDEPMSNVRDLRLCDPVSLPGFLAQYIIKNAENALDFTLEPAQGQTQTEIR